MTDDLMAGGPKAYVRRTGKGLPTDQSTAKAAFDAGNDILLYGDTRVDEIVNEL